MPIRAPYAVYRPPHSVYRIRGRVGLLAPFTVYRILSTAYRPHDHHGFSKIDDCQYQPIKPRKRAGETA